MQFGQQGNKKISNFFGGIAVISKLIVIGLTLLEDDMKLFAAFTVVSLLCAGAVAQAADLPSRSIVKPAVATAGINWSGFYVGAHAGWTGVNDRQRLYSPTFALGISNSDSGFLGGLHAGYNFQSGKMVYGVEADVSTTTLNKRFGIGAPFVATTGTIKLDFEGSIRGRLGYAMFDRGLLYGTAGVAIGHFKNSYRSAAPFAESVTSTRVGLTVGAGFEYAVTRNLIARTEYRYTDWLPHTNNLNVWLAPPGRSRSHTGQHQVTVGLSYLFGGP